MDALAPVAWAFALVLFRTAGLVVAAPLFSLSAAPAELKVALSGGIAFAAFAGAGFPPAALPAHLGALLAAVTAETLMGLFAGAAATFALEAATTAGQLAAQAMGLGFGALVDPLNGAQSTALGQLLKLGALSAAVAMGLHREAVRWLATSVVQVPPGTVESVAALARGAVVQALDAVAVGIRLGFPFLAAVTLGHVVLGLINRAAQQLHFANLAFSISILFGGAAVWLTAPALLHRAAAYALGAFPSW